MVTEPIARVMSTGNEPEEDPKAKIIREFNEAT